MLGCQEDKQETLFTTIPTRHSHLDFENVLAEDESFNIIEYLYFYNGSGIAAGDINNDGLIDLYFTANQGIDKLFLNRGSLQFEDITQQANVGGGIGINKWTSGATMVDINADGWLDIYVCEVSDYKLLEGQNRLYINQQDGTFQEAAAEYGLDISTYSQHSAFLDYDQDGDLDIFLLNHAVHTPDSYKKAAIRSIRDPLAGDRMYRNDGGRFVEVTEESGIYSGAMGYGLSVSVGDLNNDGFPDLYVTNDFHENDYLYLNQQNGTFREVIQEVTGHLSTFAMGNDLADANNDGWLDILTVDMKPDQEPILKASAGVDPYEIYQYKLSFGYHDQYSRNTLQLNRGIFPHFENIRFSEVAQIKGISATDWSWSSLLTDLNNDGQKDIFITNGIPRRPNDLDYIRYLSNQDAREGLSAAEMIQNMPDGRYANFAFQQVGDDYEDVSKDWGLDFEGYSNGAISVDLDNDGDLDIVTNNWGEKAMLFENHTNERLDQHYLKIRLHGDEENPNGVGAKISIYADGKTQVIENQLNKGWLSSVSTNIFHFGLGETQQVDSIIIRWNNQRQQTLSNVAADQILEVFGKNVAAINRNKKSPKNDYFFQPISKSGIDFIHRENGFNDFSSERLLPRLMSTEGPALAVGDVNGDGLDDIYLGGAKNQSDAIYLQQNSAVPFQKLETTVFNEFNIGEAVDATFFDADGDSDLDLYVVNAGGEVDDSPFLQDILYLNDGSGNFTVTLDALPTMRFNGSCVTPLYADSDQHIDLFIGHGALPAAYGMSGESVLLLNDGDGKFSRAKLPNNGQLGMVTDATWLADKKQLSIVGEWMPVTVMDFNSSSPTIRQIPNSSGWWKTIHAVDIDYGRTSDYLFLGNEGLNTNLSASVAQPLELYVKDFDNNRDADAVMAYYKNSQQWVYPDLDVLAKQMVSLRKTYTDYATFANRPFQEIFSAKELADSEQANVQTLSSAFIDVYDSDIQLTALPGELQWSCLQAFAAADFDGDNQLEVIAVGNFQGNTTSIGRSDGSFGHYLEWKNDNWESVPLKNIGFAIEGECRAVDVIKNNGRVEYVLVARNQDAPILFRVK
ncbi:MAG: VCBS repeat-containing protein [Bacteroidota bacterium]